MQIYEDKQIAVANTSWLLTDRHDNYIYTPKFSPYRSPHKGVLLKRHPVHETFCASFIRSWHKSYRTFSSNNYLLRPDIH